MQTNFRKQDDNVLKDLTKDRDRIAEDIGDLLSQRDSIDSDIAELRDRLQELNDDIESTKDEIARDNREKEDEFTEILMSGDYSNLAREFRRLNTKIYEIRSSTTYMGESTQQEWEVRQQRRDIVDKLLIVEEMEL